MEALPDGYKSLFPIEYSQAILVCPTNETVRHKWPKIKANIYQGYFDELFQVILYRF